MRLTLYIFFVQCALICNDYCLTSVNALIGVNIQHPNPNEYLNVVALVQVHKESRELIRKICVGSLISRRDVLTTEHCLVGEELPNLEVIAGSINLSAGQRYSLVWWITYDQWCANAGKVTEFNLNDIAILKLRSNVPEDVTIAQISQVPNSAYYGSTATIATWTSSATDTLSDLMDLGQVNVLTDNQCTKRCGKLMQPRQDIHWRYMCTAASPYIVLDNGDSGGPLMQNGVIIGINNGFCPPVPSFAINKKVNIHIGIQYYRAFIDSILEMN